VRNLNLCVKVFLTGTVAFAAGSASAECGGTVSQAVCTDVRITLLYIDANYDAYISVSANAAALPCSANGNLLKLPSASANFKAVYATLLAAQLTDRALNVRLDSSPQCTITYVSMP
jgi:hypothetical protein